MVALFNSSKKYVIIYSSNYNGKQRDHERSRKFTEWIDMNTSDWKLLRRINNPYPYKFSDPDNTSKSDFYIFKKVK